MDKALLDTDILSEILKGVDRLVSGNLSHYRRIEALGYGLKLENWR